jgi:hypothetical protein
VLAVPDTQGQPQRGIRISEGTQSQGEQPQSEQQQQPQPEQQTRQQQQPRRSGRGHQTTEQTESPPSLARSGPRTRGGHTQPQPTPRQRRAATEELTESSRLSTPSYPEVHEQRLSESISVTSVTCRAEDSAVEERTRGPVVPTGQRGV